MDPLTAAGGFGDSGGFGGDSDGFGGVGFGKSGGSSPAAATLSLAADADAGGVHAQEAPQAPPPLSAPSKEKTTFCCELDRVLTHTSANVFVPHIDTHVDLREQVRPAIIISDAAKAHDMSGSSYIAYVIRTELPQHGVELESRHRYSEFEAFRRLLTKAYPTTVVPPVPEKQTISDYAIRPGKTKEDPRVILHRKRMLQAFLNRVATHPVLNASHVFHQFLRGDAPWSEILASSGLAHLLKRKDTLSAASGAAALAAAAVSSGVAVGSVVAGGVSAPGGGAGSSGGTGGGGTSGSVSDRTPLKRPDAHFIAAEDYTARFHAQIQYIERIVKRIETHCSDMASSYGDLGSAYNSWSLTDTTSPTLSESIEQTGQALDTMYTATNLLHTSLAERTTEPMHLYTQYAASVEKLLRWRHRKHAEFEHVSESLIGKQAALVKLEQTEHASQRLAAVLGAEGSSAGGYARSLQPSTHPYEQASRYGGTAASANADGSGAEQSVQDLQQQHDRETSTSRHDTHASSGAYGASNRPYSGGNDKTADAGLDLNAATLSTGVPTGGISGTTISNSGTQAYPNTVYTGSNNSGGILATINSFMDNDPETTRRNAISRLRDTIATLETQRETLRHELLSANTEIQRDLDRFQRVKVTDLRDMLMGLVLAMREYHRRGVDAWRGARSALDRMES